MQLLNLSTQLKQLQGQSSQILRMLYVIISIYIIIVYVCCILYYYFMYINFIVNFMFCHVTYAFQSESTLHSNGVLTRNHLVRKRTLNHLGQFG